MEKKSIIINLPAELVDKIDRKNFMGDRSDFITHLLKEKINEDTIPVRDEFTTKMRKDESLINIESEILSLIDEKGASLGKFDINTLDGFEDLANKIQQVSKDPAVRIRARGWL